MARPLESLSLWRTKHKIHFQPFSFLLACISSSSQQGLARVTVLGGRGVLLVG